MQPQRTRIEYLPKFDLFDAGRCLAASYRQHLRAKIVVRRPVAEFNDRQQAVVKLWKPAFEQGGRVAIRDGDKRPAADHAKEDQHHHRGDRGEHDRADQRRRLEKPIGRKRCPKRRAQPCHGGGGTFQPNVLADAATQRAQHGPCRGGKCRSVVVV